MADFDYPIAQTPKLIPLENSYAGNAVEKEIKDLTLEIFRKYLADDAYDINVAGASHLGSFDLVRRTVTSDGLALLQGDREEAAARYLYRAWRSRDVNGRGMHFLRTYLQMLFPNVCEVAQCWQSFDEPYTKGLMSALDEGFTPDPSRQWLTSRIEIGLDISVEYGSILSLSSIFRSVLPARLVPMYRFWIRFELFLYFIIDHFEMEIVKDVDLWKEWCGRVITERPSARWKLGKDDGSTPAWKLRNCRVITELDCDSEATIPFGRLPKLGQPGRKLDGTWKVAAHGHMSVGHEIDAQVEADAFLDIRMSDVTISRAIDAEIPYRSVRRLGESGLRLDGSWSLGSALTISSEMRHCREIEIDYRAIDGVKISNVNPSHIDGSWKLSHDHYVVEGGLLN